jgi:2-oxoglutarate dehydrogenase E2 component (dihydrolipoamide succinyltransferase)
MSTEIRVPTLGESVTEATVATWFKKPGDEIAADDMLCELETDKVTVEVPSPAAGTLGEIVAGEGETVGVDALLATIEEGAGAGANGGGSEAGEDGGVAAAEGKEKVQAEDAGYEEVRVKSDEEQSSGSGDGDGGGGGGGEAVDVTVPTLGESVTEATIGSWFKKVGDAVEADEPLCELETDKVSVEVPAPAAGTLSEILAEEGSTVEVDARIAVLSKGEGASKPSGGSKAKSDDTGGEPDRPATDYGRSDEEEQVPDGGARGSGRKDTEDAPSAKSMMAEHGIERGQVKGTGRDGRIMKADVMKAIETLRDAPQEKPEQKAPPRAPVAAEDEGREERVKMTRLRRTIARRLKDAQNTAAMLTTYNEVDMTEVMALRSEYKELFEKKHGVKLGFMSFFTKACCHALQEVPEVNAEIDGEEVVYKHFVHMGIAVGTPNGLVVPVVRDADSMGFAEIEKAINAMGKKARDGKLGMADMQGGTFTISNGGVYGSLMSSPILNPPQSGILGMHKIMQRPMVVGGEILARPMMYLALSYDHRIVDGKGAVTFLVRVKEALEDPRRLLMDL